MSAFRLASRYARSLIELALEKNQLEEVNKDVRHLQSVLKQSRELRLLLRSPIVNIDRKNKIMDQLFSKDMGEIMMTFLRLVVNKRRDEYLPDVINEFIDQYNRHRKITPVFLATAVPVDDEVISNLRELYLSRTGDFDIELNTRVDPGLIGGFIFRYGDKMYDFSISRQLEKMDDIFLVNPYLRRYN